jgi:hypothetical protein
MVETDLDKTLDELRFIAEGGTSLDDRTKEVLRDAVNLVSRLKQMAEQYRDDMRHPPASDSRDRRIEWIDAIVGAN